MKQNIVVLKEYFLSLFSLSLPWWDLAFHSETLLLATFSMEATHPPIWPWDSEQCWHSFSSPMSFPDHLFSPFVQKASPFKPVLIGYATCYFMLLSISHWSVPHVLWGLLHAILNPSSLALCCHDLCPCCWCLLEEFLCIPSPMDCAPSHFSYPFCILGLTFPRSP